MNRPNEAHSPDTQPKLPVDRGPFMGFGRWMGKPLGEGGWTGQLIASPVAFYFLKVLTSAKLGDDDTRTCRLADLDRDIRNQLDPAGKHPENDVIVFPNTAISRIDVTGKIDSKIIIHRQTYKFRVGMFEAASKRQFLLDHHWKLDTDLTPTTPPIHGQSLGRPPGYAPATPKIGGRFGTVIMIIAIILMLISLLVKIFVATAHHR